MIVIHIASYYSVVEGFEWRGFANVLKELRGVWGRPDEMV
jgi:hypothetical protein